MLPAQSRRFGSLTLRDPYLSHSPRNQVLAGSPISLWNETDSETGTKEADVQAASCALSNKVLFPCWSNCVRSANIHETGSVQLVMLQIR